MKSVCGRRQLCPLSHGRGLLASDGSPIKMFIDFVFSDHSVGIEFLMNIGLLRRRMQCKT
jgi:hypothetical protein